MCWVLGPGRPVGVAFHAFWQITGTDQVKDIRDLRKVRQTQHQYPLFGHKEIKRVRFKKTWKKIHWAGDGKSDLHKIWPNLSSMLSCFYLEAMIGFNWPITAIVVCTAGINIFEPCAFNLQVQRFMTRANPGRFYAHIRNVVNTPNLI